MSMPSSSALVLTTPRTVPSRRPCSISRRCNGRYPPRRGGYPAAIAANRSRLAETVRERLLQVAEQDLDLQARPAEDDRLHSGAQEGLGDPLTLERRRAPDAELPIDNGR